MGNITLKEEYRELLDITPQTMSPGRPTKALIPTRRLIPKVVIAKRPPEGRFNTADRVPRNAEPAPYPSKHKSSFNNESPSDNESPPNNESPSDNESPSNDEPLFTPAHSDVECEDQVSLSDDDSDLPAVPDRPFNQFRVATQEELPSPDQPVPIQLGRPKLPWMDTSPYRIACSTARIVRRPEGYRVNGFEPFFSFFDKGLDRFLLVPGTHCVTGWPMYPGSHRVVAREWNEIDAALKEHLDTPKRRRGLESPSQHQAKKARHLSPEVAASIPTSQRLPASPTPFADTFSDSASDYSTTQKKRRLEGREYSLSGSEEDNDGEKTPTEAHVAPETIAAVTPPRPSGVNKGKGKARAPTPGPSTARPLPAEQPEPLTLTEEARDAAIDAIETLMSIAVEFKTDFPSIFAAVDVSVDDFFPPMPAAVPTKRLGRPRYNNPYNIWMAYYRVVLDKEGRSECFTPLLCHHLLIDHQKFHLLSSQQRLVIATPPSRI
jgi:hypothetical protein